MARPNSRSYMIFLHILFLHGSHSQCRMLDMSSLQFQSTIKPFPSTGDSIISLLSFFRFVSQKSALSTHVKYGENEWKADVTLTANVSCYLLIFKSFTCLKNSEKKNYVVSCNLNLWLISVEKGTLLR